MKKIVARGKWKTVKFAKNDSDDEINFDDLIEFQELTDYVIEEGPAKTKKRKAKQNEEDNAKKSKLDVGKEETEPNRAKVKKQKKSKMNKPDNERSEEIKFDDEKPSDSKNPIISETKHELPSDSTEDTSYLSGMSNWNGMFACNEILKALSEKNFTSPTAIQTLTLPSAIRDRMDIIGAAETGSGKTLAFAIPIVTRLLQMKNSFEDDRENGDCEVEAMEMDNDVDSNVEDEADNDIDSNIEDEADSDDDVNDQDNTKETDDLFKEEYDEKTSIVIENIKSTKTNYLKALIMTPTRELAIQIKDHIEVITKYTNIKCAVLVGGMAPEKQTRRLAKEPDIVIATPGRLWELIQQREPHVYKMKYLRFLVIDEVDRMMEKQHFEELEQILNHVHQKCKQKKQVFVFSATLTFVHTKPKRSSIKRNKRMKDMTVEDKLDSLKKKLQMSNKPKVVDLTKGQQMMSQKLVEQKINCTSDKKDAYLYYFLKCHPGRTIVFANSKDCIRRLTSLANVLHHVPLPLHADMPQRQRLKNMDRFKENERGLLLATDVAARGLDIPDVQHVIHYQVPKTAENYVHRSGRTARSNKDGLSVIFISPEEESLFQKIAASLKRDKELPKFEMDQTAFSKVTKIVALARTLEKEMYTVKKKKNHKDWVAKMAAEADMIFDEMEDGSDAEEQAIKDHEKRKSLESLQAELNQLLGVGEKPKKKNKKKFKKPKEMKQGN